MKGDWFAIILVTVLAVVVIAIFQNTIQETKVKIVSVYQDGKLTRELPLDEDLTFEVNGTYHNKIRIEKGKVAIVASDCPGTDCVHSGWIHRAGRSIVCLPNRVEIRVGGATEVDFIVR